MHLFVLHLLQHLIDSVASFLQLLLCQQKGLPPPPFQEEMESLLLTQEQLKKGSQRINQMLQEMENKQVHMLS